MQLKSAYRKKDILRLGGIPSQLRSSRPIAIAGFFGLIYMNADIVMLGFLRPTEEVGIYAAVSRLLRRSAPR